MLNKSTGACSALFGRIQELRPVSEVISLAIFSRQGLRSASEGVKVQSDAVMSLKATKGTLGIEPPLRRIAAVALILRNPSRQER